MSAAFDPEDFVAHLDEDDWDDLIDYVLDWLEANSEGDAESESESDAEYERLSQQFARDLGATTGGHPARVTPASTASLFDASIDAAFRATAGLAWRMVKEDYDEYLEAAALVFPTWTDKGHHAIADLIDSCGPDRITPMQLRDVLVCGITRCDTAADWTPNAAQALAIIVAMNSPQTCDENGLMFGIPGAVMLYDPVERLREKSGNVSAHEGDDGTAAMAKPDGFLVLSPADEDDRDRVVFDDYEDLLPLMAPLLMSPMGGTDRYLVRWTLDAYMNDTYYTILGVAEVLGSSPADAAHTFDAWVTANHANPVEITGVGLTADDLDDPED